ncbi:MAG TPA: Gfo/Idh/MocA family oxidoreductase [Anaerolineaceae bacterium]
MTERVKIGIVGCGNISGIYLKMSKTFPILDVAAVADKIPERAQAKAAEYGIARACTTAELLADPEIEIVVNLTTPDAHAEVALAALQAGKSVYNEKPLAIRREDAQQMLALAKAKGLRVGGAPDTFLGAGIQTCRKLIDEGAIGFPVAATAYMLCHGHESWHPDPEFYYQVGGGPMFDMGPYYLTALVNLLGGVQRVTGSARISFPTRTITSQPKNGKVIQVETPTHITGVLDFVNGAMGSIITSFDVWKASMPWIEIYGSEGTLAVPDPNTFGGVVKVWKPGAQEWKEIPLVPNYAQNTRSLGVADMAHAIRSGRPHRASGELTYHVLDIMHAIHDASREGRHILLQSACERPAPMPYHLPAGVLDD